MAIKPKCDICKLEMAEFGAILLGPPDNNSTVSKFHICIYCYTLVLKKFDISDSSPFVDTF